MRRPAAALLALLTVLAVVLSGCAQLPTSGPVRHESAAAPDEPLDAPYFDPPGPAEDGSPSAIVSGFFVAQQANPLSTRVARQFLSERVRATWQPNRGTVVYDALTVLPTSGGATVRLSDVRRLDARGGWRGGEPGETEDLDIDLVSEDGQWRIDNPPPQLVVPASFFDRAFERTNLHFFDQTGTVLLPDPVFIPRGEQSATNLVRGLLAGPGEALAEVSRSAFPRGTDLELSVVVTESGVAEVPLTRELLQAPAAELERAADQLVWTLGQLPGIESVRLTVGGTPVPMPSGGIDTPVTRAPRLDAAGSADPTLYTLRDDRLLRTTPAGSEPVAGPLADHQLPARSFAVASEPRRVAAVLDGGRRLVEVPLTDEGEQRELLTGQDLARPSYDMFGDLWVLDRGAARVLLVSDGRVREVEVPRVTGEQVSSLEVAHDGSRLVVGYPSAPQVRVVDVLRTDEGEVSGARRSRALSVGSDPPAVDVGWRDPATLAVLTRPTEETSAVDFVSVDGSPLGASTQEPTAFREAASAMVVSPRSGTALRLLTPDERAYALSAEGTWPRSASGVTAAAYGP
ncbi:LpqB family beta-propeller domain-containing protein [Nocardioides aequoreus]|uniref:LpqB family beta-propeller domain-containing protein n=1 Tax=Nocardioides aequoreus TaxID=397278 RepID=UPI0004C3065D|nr:LpqB family beta-propeller domain-containing protein [Nocardioides aequoreus]